MYRSQTNITQLSVRLELLCFLPDHVGVYGYIVKSKLNQGL